MNTNSHTADALREILATCADPLNRACEEYAKLERKLAETNERLSRAMRNHGEQLMALHAQRAETRRTEELRAALEWYADRSKWRVSDDLKTSEIRAGDAWSIAEDALKKADTQGEVQPSGNTSREAGPKVGSDPAASAPCVVSEDSDELRGENAVLWDRIVELDAELAHIHTAFNISTNDAVIVKAHELEEGPLASAPCNVEGPAHLCPKPAPGFELDKRGVLVATDRGPSAPCVARPSEETVKLAKSVMRHVGDISHLTSGMAAECLAREILRLDERNGDK